VNFARANQFAVASERRFFAWLAGLIVVLVFVGFARTYYLHTFFGMPALSRFLHFHGVVMTGWIVLFAVQTFLIASHHRQTHRILGVFGAGYTVLVAIMGCTATVLSARHAVLAHSEFVSSILTVLALELTQMILFAFLVAIGIWFRNRPGYHKRLMLLATLCMLPNPIVRLFVWTGFGTNIVILSFWASLAVAIVLFDSIQNRKMNPAFGFGSTTSIAFLYLAYFASRTPVWQQFAAKVVR
jgi:hypothetical protein